MYDADKAYTHTIKNSGYPLTTWVRITYENKNEPFCSPSKVVLIEVYADEACTKVLSQDDDGASYSEAQIEAINLCVRVDINERKCREETTKLVRLAQARKAAQEIKAEPVPFLLQSQAG